MDPHSRHSQFNQRIPKSGPKSLNVRFMDLAFQSKPSLDNFKPSAASTPKKPSTTPSSSLMIRRPIATNSRIRQEEKFRKDMYLAFVENALQQRLVGNSDPFNELVDQFNIKAPVGEGAPQLAQLRLWISALSHVVSRLDRLHAPLVNAIVNLPWITLDTATVKSYTLFIGVLLSAKPEYLSLVLGKATQGLTHQSGIKALYSGGPESSSSPLTRGTIYERIHYLLKHLLSLIPTLPSTLQPLLVRNFPHKRQNLVAQSTYIRNLLRISTYCPELSDKILATIVDRAIQIDVEIQIETDELEECPGALDEDVFQIDLGKKITGEEEDTDDDDEENDDLSDISSDAGDMDDKPPPEIPTDVGHIQEMIEKLDCILGLLFKHFKYTYSSSLASPLEQPSRDQSSPLPDFPSIPSSDLLPSSSLVSEDELPTPNQHMEMASAPSTPRDESSITDRAKALLRAQFHTLLAIFDRTILRTFKSRYTQFLLFWYTSIDPEFSDIFQGMLVDRALFESSADSTTHNNTPLVTRAAAASYIGSFVSRASFVDREGARRVMGVLCEYLNAHLDSVEEAMKEGDVGLGSMAQHTVFYAVAQAVFLIFCFRWRDLFEEEDAVEDLLLGPARQNKTWMPQLSVLQRVVNSALNPLKICSPSVVTQFAKTAHATDFIYCYTILDSNKRHDLISARNGSKQRAGIPVVFLEGAMNAELNTFFPFDPYRLPKSAEYIQGCYREWASVAIDGDDEDDEEDSDSDDDAYALGRSSPAFNAHLAIPISDSRKADDGGLGESLGAMSISPAQPAKAIAAYS